LDVPEVRRGALVTVVEMQVSGMTCRHCVRAVTARLRDLPGVVAVEADAGHARLVVHGDVTAEEVRAAVDDVSFAAGGPQHDAAASGGG
jgi:copper chaperone CopZ